MPRSGRTHGVLIAVLVVYLAVLAVIAFWPVPVDTGSRGLLLTLLGRLRGQGFGWIDYSLVESTANVILFVPFGLLLGMLGGPGRRLLMLAVCVAVSVLIELGQAVLLPARFASVGDVVTNTAGAIVGALLALAIDRHRRRNAARPSGADPAR